MMSEHYKCAIRTESDARFTGFEAIISKVVTVEVRCLPPMLNNR